MMEGWNQLMDRFYRKKDIYELGWQGIDFNKLKLVGAPYGGPIALTRDNSKMLMVKETNLSPMIDIYTSSGNKLGSILVDQKRMPIVKMGWSDDERLIIITEDGVLYQYNVFGQLLSKFAIEVTLRTFEAATKETHPNALQECQKGVYDCYIFPAGAVVISRTYKLILIHNWDQIRVLKLRDANLTEAPRSWTVIEPQVSVGAQGQVTTVWSSADGEPSVDVLLALDSGTVLVVSRDEATDMALTNGPFLKMAVSPTGKILACFNERGDVWVVSTDFNSNLSTFATKSTQPPTQLVWCGPDAVVCYWSGGEDNMLFLIGPRTDKDNWLKFSYDEPIQLVPEPDGLRIFSPTQCEFLQRVPNVVESVLKMGSTSPGAMLLAAWEWFQKKSAKADDTLRHDIKQDLGQAVDHCIEAAAHEFDPAMQRKLLKAAAYGKAFIDEYNSDFFVEICRTLRVLNGVRYFEIGMPLTYTQYKLMGTSLLIDRLLARHHHLLAFKICDYLHLPSDRVLIHWAIAKVHASSNDEQTAKDIVKKLKSHIGISFAEIASAAHRKNKTALATMLLDYEPRPADQVPLLLSMRQYEAALLKSLQSGDTDLVHLVLVQLRGQLAASELMHLIGKYDTALALYMKSCKEHDKERDKLRELYVLQQRPDLLAGLLVREAYQHPDLETRREKLHQAMNQYKKVDPTAAKATEEQIGLLLLQKELEVSLGGKFVGSSLSNTLYRLILMGEHKRVLKIKNEFKVPDKRYWWLRIKALAEAHEWTELEQFSKEKKSPIGYAPFAEVCLQANKLDEATKYVRKITEPDQRARYWARLGQWSEAVAAARDARDPNLLIYLRNRCPDPALVANIDQLLQQQK